MIGNYFLGMHFHEVTKPCPFRLAKTEIKQLENEVGRWQVLVEAVTGISPPDFDAQTLAVLRGRLVRYLMRSREVRVSGIF